MFNQPISHEIDKLIETGAIGKLKHNSKITGKSRAPWLPGTTKEFECILIDRNRFLNSKQIAFERKVFLSEILTFFSHRQVPLDLQNTFLPFVILFLLATIR